jgi:RPA family protein
MAEQKTSNEFKRQTAFKCGIESLNNGVFVKRPGWESSFLMTDYGDFSRVNIIAVVVAKEDNNITLDDGTGQLGARFFDNPAGLDNFIVGDLVVVVGRPREFNNRTYLTLEIIKKINNKLWIAYRKKELTLIKKLRDVSELRQDVKTEKEPVVQESTNTMNSRDKILRNITTLDNGDGASIEDVIKISAMKNAEEILQDMILRGDIFEYKAGRIKLM